MKNETLYQKQLRMLEDQIRPYRTCGFFGFYKLVWLDLFDLTRSEALRWGSVLEESWENNSLWQFIKWFPNFLYLMALFTVFFTFCLFLPRLAFWGTYYIERRSIQKRHQRLGQWK